MRPQSAKAKGRRLQQFVRDILLKYAPSLTTDDIRSTSMGAGGEDILLSSQAQAIYPYAIECKNVEKLNVHDALAQAQANARGRIPMLVFKRNNTKTYVALELEAFLELTKKDP